MGLRRLICLARAEHGKALPSCTHQLLLPDGWTYQRGSDGRRKMHRAWESYQIKDHNFYLGQSIQHPSPVSVRPSRKGEHRMRPDLENLFKIPSTRLFTAEQDQTTRIFEMLSQVLGRG